VETIIDRFDQSLLEDEEDWKAAGVGRVKSTEYEAFAVFDAVHRNFPQ